MMYANCFSAKISSSINPIVTITNRSPIYIRRVRIFYGTDSLREKCSWVLWFHRNGKWNSERVNKSAEGWESAQEVWACVLASLKMVQGREQQSGSNSWILPTSAIDGCVQRATGEIVTIFHFLSQNRLESTRAM